MVRPLNSLTKSAGESACQLLIFKWADCPGLPVRYDLCTLMKAKHPKKLDLDAIAMLSGAKEDEDGEKDRCGAAIALCFHCLRGYDTTFCRVFPLPPWL